MDGVSALTRRLVSIPSHEDETAAGDEIESWLRSNTDAEVTRDVTGNVVARRGSSAPEAPSLALVGHHDVVPPGEGGYAIEERDGRLYGRGTADMKGSLAAAMCAFRDSELDGGAEGSPGVELVFASFVGEERGGVGARAAIDGVAESGDPEARESAVGSRGGFAPDYAIVGEGSTSYSAEGVTDVVVAHRGRRGSTLVASGRSAHASEPEAGVNAIYRACEAVERVRELPVPDAEVFGERLRGSVAVTEIDGGTAWNVVPDRCAVTVDERTVPGERVPLERIEGLDGVEWTVDQDLPPMACDEEAFAELVLEAASGAQEGDPRLVTKPHATDAGWLAEAGTTCVVCGASEPGEAHTDHESVSLEVLERCYRIYRGVAESIRA
ncbi:MAG: M20 family metallopeptidase [Salinigranum sp.]